MKYFGTDGIRGIPFESLDENLIRKIGNACITHGIKKCVLGYDTRESSVDLSNFSHNFLALALSEKSLNIIPLLGLTLTPFIIFGSFKGLAATKSILVASECLLKSKQVLSA